jgi:hypothetical protein
MIDNLSVFKGSYKSSDKDSKAESLKLSLGSFFTELIIMLMFSRLLGQVAREN